jgi:hypothetical protein
VGDSLNQNGIKSAIINATIISGDIFERAKGIDHQGRAIFYS